MLTELLAKETASSKFSLHLNSQEKKRSLRMHLLLHKFLACVFLFFTSIYDCYKFYIFKTNSLCNIFSDNDSFTVVRSCAHSNLLNNFTIVSSYLHAILTNKISCVKNKNDVPQAWVWTVKIYETREDSRLLFLFFLELSVFFKGWLLSHMWIFLFLSFFFLLFIFSDGYYSTVIHGMLLIYQYLHRLEPFLQVGF